jgi:hypothetical protein
MAGCDVPKDVVWLILREVIAKTCGCGWTVIEFFESGVSLSRTSSGTSLVLLLLQRVCRGFRSVLKSKCVWFCGAGYLFKPGSFVGHRWENVIYRGIPKDVAVLRDNQYSGWVRARDIQA